MITTCSIKSEWNSKEPTNTIRSLIVFWTAEMQYISTSKNLMHSISYTKNRKASLMNNRKTYNKKNASKRNNNKLKNNKYYKLNCGMSMKITKQKKWRTLNKL